MYKNFNYTCVVLKKKINFLRNSIKNLTARLLKPPLNIPPKLSYVFLYKSLSKTFCIIFGIYWMVFLIIRIQDIIQDPFLL